MKLAAINALVDQVGARGASVRVVVAATLGSTPREAGAWMLVDDTAIFGTIGGGALEYAAIERARALLDEPARAAEPWRRAVGDYPLGPACGQCCGGHATLLFEVFGPLETATLRAAAASNANARAVLVRPLASGAPIAIVADRRAVAARPLAVERKIREFIAGTGPRDAVIVRGGGGDDWLVEPVGRPQAELYLYGSGHVGRAFVRVSDGLPWRITWIDTAAPRFPATLPDHVRMVIDAHPARVAAGADAGCLHLVMTFSHPLDLAICHELLSRGDFTYLGLIGSATKRARFRKRLLEMGVTPGQLDRLACPIGLPGVAGKEPATIALSVAADLLQRLAAMEKGAVDAAATEAVTR